MRIIADRNIPLLPSLLAEQELVQIDAREISADSLTQADALVVRSVTQVDSRLLTVRPFDLSQAQRPGRPHRFTVACQFRYRFFLSRGC